MASFCLPYLSDNVYCSYFCSDEDLVRKGYEHDSHLRRNTSNKQSHLKSSEASRRRCTSSGSTFSETSDDSLAACETEEEKLMREMGLPTAFASTKSYHQDNYTAEVAYKKNVSEQLLHDAFLVYWEKNGRDLVVKAWNDKYGAHTNSDCEDLSLSDDVKAGGEDYSNAWTELWATHYQNQYESEYYRFIEKSPELEELMQSLAIESVDAGDKGDQRKSGGAPESQRNGEIIPTTPAVIPEQKTRRVEDSDSDGPPDERPVKIKKTCEFDADENVLPSETSGQDSDEVWKQIEPKKRKVTPKANASLQKYWTQRYRLFSRFDEGIRLDEESWYSVTPERIAQHIAKRCLSPPNTSVIIDGFCGAGGNTIQFALASPHLHVIATDIDPEKIEIAQNNARVYKVDDRIDFIVGDFMKIAASGALKADVVFLSPPWGGPEYLNKDNYSLDMMTPNGKDIIKLVQENISPNIAILLPRNIIEDEVMQLAGDGKCVEIEQNRLNKKVKTVTAYYGSLLK